MRPNEDTFDCFGYGDTHMLDYIEHSPTWQDLFGDDFDDDLDDDLFDEDDLDEDDADIAGEQSQSR